MFLSFRDPAKLCRAFGTLAALPATFFAPNCAARPDIRLESDMKFFLSDNPFLISGKNRAAAAVEIIARPEFVWPVTPTTSLDVSAVVAVRHYLRRYGDFVTGRALASVRHRENEFLSLSGSVSYTRELPTDGLTDSIDAAVDTRSVRESYSARSSVDWTPNATTSVDADIGVQRARYPNSVLLSSINAYDLGVALSKRVSPVMSLGVRAQMTVSNVANRGDSSATAVWLTVSRRLATAWRADAQVGIERTSLEGPPGDGRDRRTRFSGSANLCYEPSRLAACLTAAVQSEVSGLSGLQREVSFGASVTRRLTERGSLAATADYRRARLEGRVNSLDVLHASTSYEHRLSRGFSLSTGVDYVRRTQLSGQKIGAVIFQIGVTFRGQPR